jgi:hypothetical protein
MLVTLTPGVDRNRVLELLYNASVLIDNYHGKPSEYMQWVMETARVLRGQISRADLEELLVTPTFDRLLAGVGAGTMVGQSLLLAELTDRKQLFTEAYETLKKEITAWSVPPATIVATVDTTVFCTHPAWTRDDNPAKVIGSIPWAQELNAGVADILLVLPEVVIRELDRHKESGNKTLRYRSQVTLAVIDRLLSNPHGTVTIQEASDGWHEDVDQRQIPTGTVHLKVFYDDPAHQPLDDEDAEIIDRTRALETLAGQPVCLITMDTTMGLNARRFGLKVAKPLREIEEPPVDGQSTRARRRDRAAGGSGNGHSPSEGEP